MQSAQKKAFDRTCGLKLCVGLIALVLLLPYTVQAQNVSEAQLKAAFIYNFSKYAELPESAFPNNSNFVICIFGEQGSQELINTVRGKTIDERVIEVKSLSASDLRNQKPDCQMIFAPGVISAAVQSLLNISQQHGILTVGDHPAFCEAGGIINFYPQDNKVRFEISVRNAEASGIKLSSQLLKLARIVEE